MDDAATVALYPCYPNKYTRPLSKIGSILGQPYVIIETKFTDLSHHFDNIEYLYRMTYMIHVLSVFGFS